MGRPAHGVGRTHGQSGGQIRRTVGQARMRDGEDEQHEHAGGNLENVLGQGRGRVRVDRGQAV